MTAAVASVTVPPNYDPEKDKGKFMNPMMLAMAAGMGFAVLHISLPDVLMTALRMLGEASIPLMLLALAAAQGLTAADAGCVPDDPSALADHLRRLVLRRFT